MTQKTGHRGIWVLGGTGFIGSSLVRHLSSDSKNQVNILINQTLKYKQLEGFNTISGSIANFDYNWLERFPPDAVFHLARMSGSSRIGRFVAGYRGNMANTKMVRKFISLSKPPIVVYVSGSLMYGNQTSGFALESSSLRPEAFGRYYYKAEEPWIQAQKSGSLDVRFARPSWVVGPSSWFKAFFWNYIKANKMVPIYGTGKQLMSLVHIEDCARLIEALYKYGSRGQNLNVFGCKPITQEDFSELLSSITGLPIKRLTFEETGKMYGTTATHALVSSTPMDTLYPEIHQAAQIKHDSPKKILSSVIRLLENEQGVFTKTPKDGFAN